MVVIDTNVLAYLLIEGDRTEAAQALYALDPEWRSEAFVLVEFCNVLATCQRTGALRATETHALLAAAERLLRGLVNLPPVQTLRIAERYRVSAYDARFLGVAETARTRLVTEDAKLRAAAPDLTRSIAQALGR